MCAFSLALLVKKEAGGRLCIRSTDSVCAAAAAAGAFWCCEVGGDSEFDFGDFGTRTVVKVRMALPMGNVAKHTTNATTMITKRVSVVALMRVNSVVGIRCYLGVWWVF